VLRVILFFLCFNLTCFAKSVGDKRISKTKKGSPRMKKIYKKHRNKSSNESGLDLKTLTTTGNNPYKTEPNNGINQIE